MRKPLRPGQPRVRRHPHLLVAEERDRLQERVEELEAQVAEQSQVDSLRRLRADVRELVDRNAGLLQSDEDDKSAAGKHPAASSPGGDSGSEPTADPPFASLELATRRDLIDHPAIRRAIEATAVDAKFSDKWFDRAMAILATSDEPLSAQAVARMTTVSDSTMWPVLQDLSKTGVVESIGERPEQFALDREVLERRIALEEPDLDHPT